MKEKAEKKKKDFDNCTKKGVKCRLGAGCQHLPPWYDVVR
jgi:hypothetical protein